MHKALKTTTSLATLLPGHKARVAALCGGQDFKRRLAAMGILPGAELIMVRSGHNGPVIVEVRGTQFILGRGMAQRVLLEQVS